MRIILEHREPGTRFTAATAENQIGRTVPANVQGREPGQGTVVAARVTEDGAVLELTVEFAGPGAVALERALTPELRSFSIGTQPTGRPTPTAETGIDLNQSSLRRWARRAEAADGSEHAKPPAN